MIESLTKNVKIEGLKFPTVTKEEKVPTDATLEQVTVQLHSPKKSVDSLQLLILPYRAEGMPCCVHQSRNIVSGPFSGCIWAKYKQKGVEYVIHVATASDKAKDRKDDWNTFKGNTQDISDVVECKPSEAVENPNCVQPQFMGVITNNGTFYSILLAAATWTAPETRSVEDIVKNHPWVTGTSEQNKKVLAKGIKERGRDVHGHEVIDRWKFEDNKWEK